MLIFIFSSDLLLTLSFVIEPSTTYVSNIFRLSSESFPHRIPFVSSILILDFKTFTLDSFFISKNLLSNEKLIFSISIFSLKLILDFKSLFTILFLDNVDINSFFPLFHSRPEPKLIFNLSLVIPLYLTLLYVPFGFIISLSITPLCIVVFASESIETCPFIDLATNTPLSRNKIFPSFIVPSSLYLTPPNSKPFLK